MSAGASTALMTGEVTSIEGDYDHLVHYTVVRGYEQTHRLQRARRSRTFENSTDGAIATRDRQGSRPHDRLRRGSERHPSLRRAGARRPTGSSCTGAASRSATRRGSPTAGSTSAPHLACPPVGLVGASHRRCDGWTRHTDAPVRSEPALAAPPDQLGRPDERGRGPGVGRRRRHGRVGTRTAGVGDGLRRPRTRRPGEGPWHAGDARPPVDPVPPELPRGQRRRVRRRRPSARLGVGRPERRRRGRRRCGRARRQHVRRGRGQLHVHTGVVAGAKVVLENVPAPFAGDWYVTTARHVFDVAEGYDIRFEVSGRHDRSLRGLMAGGTTQRGQERARGPRAGHRHRQHRRPRSLPRPGRAAVVGVRLRHRLGPGRAARARRSARAS